MEVALSKRQVRALAGMGSESDSQRMKGVFLDVGAGKPVDVATCPNCNEAFVRRLVDLGEYCCTECAQQYAASVARANFEAGAMRPGNNQAKRDARAWVVPQNHLGR